MLKYLVDGIEFEDFNEVVEYIIENGIGEEDYDNMLDACYEDIDICGIIYSPSLALYRVDEVAYRCGLNDYRDSKREDIEWELNNIEVGCYDKICGINVEVIEVFPSFKVKCIKNEEEDIHFTVGKVYEVVNGTLIDNDNNINLPYTCDIEDLEDINGINDGYEFELVEE